MLAIRCIANVVATALAAVCRTTVAILTRLARPVATTARAIRRTIGTVLPIPNVTVAIAATRATISRTGHTRVAVGAGAVTTTVAAILLTISTVFPIPIVTGAIAATYAAILRTVGAHLPNINIAIFVTATRAAVIDARIAGFFTVTRIIAAEGARPTISVTGGAVLTVVAIGIATAGATIGWTAIAGFIVGAVSVPTTLSAVSFTSRTILRRVTIVVTAGDSRGYTNIYSDRTTIVAAIIGAADQTCLAVVITVAVTLALGTLTIVITEIFITVAAHAFIGSRYAMDANIDPGPTAELSPMIKGAEGTGNTIGLAVAISFAVHTGALFAAVILVTHAARMATIAAIARTRRAGLARITGAVAA
jgi:hypothetical protein